MYRCTYNAGPFHDCHDCQICIYLFLINSQGCGVWYFRCFFRKIGFFWKDQVFDESQKSEETSGSRHSLISPLFRDLWNKEIIQTVTGRHKILFKLIVCSRQLVMFKYIPRILAITADYLAHRVFYFMT